MTSSNNSDEAPKEPKDTVRIHGFIAGTFSGLTKLAVGHPMDTWKVRMQVAPQGYYKGSFDCLARTVRNEGVLALYKGATPPALGWAMSDTLLMGSLHNYRLWIKSYEEKKRRARGMSEDEAKKIGLSLPGHGLAGILAGNTVCIISTPIELLKAKLQVQMSRAKAEREFSGPVDLGKKIYAHDGLKGFWRGMASNMCFRSHFGVMFTSYEIMHRTNQHLIHLQDTSPSPPWYSKLGMKSAELSNFVFGGLGSTFYWFGSFPFDAIKNRIMTDSLTNPTYTTWRMTAATIYREGGLKNFYRGFLPCLIRAFPTNASAIFVWEGTMKLLGAEKIGGSKS